VGRTPIKLPVLLKSPASVSFFRNLHCDVTNDYVRVSDAKHAPVNNTSANSGNHLGSLNGQYSENGHYAIVCVCNVEQCPSGSRWLKKWLFPPLLKRATSLMKSLQVIFGQLWCWKMPLENQIGCLMWMQQMANSVGNDISHWQGHHCAVVQILTCLEWSLAVPGIACFLHKSFSINSHTTRPGHACVLLCMQPLMHETTWFEMLCMNTCQSMTLLALFSCKKSVWRNNATLVHAHAVGQMLVSMKASASKNKIV